MKPVNPEFEPIVLTGAEKGDLQVIAEFVEVLSLEAPQQENITRDDATAHGWPDD